VKQVASGWLEKSVYRRKDFSSLGKFTGGSASQHEMGQKRKERLGVVLRL